MFNCGNLSLLFNCVVVGCGSYSTHKFARKLKKRGVPTPRRDLITRTILGGSESRAKLASDTNVAVCETKSFQFIIIETSYKKHIETHVTCMLSNRNCSDL